RARALLAPQLGLLALCLGRVSGFLPALALRLVAVRHRDPPSHSGAVSVFVCCCWFCCWPPCCFRCCRERRFLIMGLRYEGSLRCHASPSLRMANVAGLAAVGVWRGGSPCLAGWKVRRRSWTDAASPSTVAPSSSSPCRLCP